MQIHERIRSEKDNTEKFVFKLQDDLLAEFSYIDKEDGKIIICVSTQTGCRMRCKFCHLTMEKNLQTIRGIYDFEIQRAVEFILEARKPIDRHRKTLLISYMGAGEPLENVENITQSARYIEDEQSEMFDTVRFAVATMIPKNRIEELFELVRGMRRQQLKLHYSLHTMDPDERKEVMPNSLSGEFGIMLLKYIAERYYNVKLEIHYTLIKEFNDYPEDIKKLAELMIPTKFIKLATKEGYDGEPTDFDKYTDECIPAFKAVNNFCEYYDPPGADVGASCGQIHIASYRRDDE